MIDSCANTHLIGDQFFLSDLVPIVPTHVTTPDGPHLNVKGKGVLDIFVTQFSNVLYVPYACSNLLLVGKIANLGNTICFTISNCSVYDKRNWLCLIGSRHPTSCLYTLNQLSRPSSLSCNTISLVPPPNVELWHRRIGHIYFQSLYHMTKEHLVDGVPSLPHIKGLCSVCVQAKQTKEKIPCLSLY